MKIRTDFVTNSSSSSYVVEIAIKFTDGTEAFVSLGDVESSNANLLCNAGDVLKCRSIASLAKLLDKALEHEQEDEQERDEYKEELSEFFERVSKKHTKINDIDTITFCRIWSAWGEASSAFGWNMDCFAEELPKLAAKVCETRGEAKKKAKKELEKYLSNLDLEVYGNWQGYFPTGFMGSKATGTLVWTQLADSIEEFAQKIVEIVTEDIPGADYAEETTTINIKSKDVTQTAEYLLREKDYRKLCY